MRSCALSSMFPLFQEVAQQYRQTLYLVFVESKKLHLNESFLNMFIGASLPGYQT